MDSYNTQIYFKHILNIFLREEQFLKSNKLTISIIYNYYSNKLEFYFIDEDEVCLFSLSNQKVLNKIIKYLLNKNYILFFKEMQTN